MLINIFLTTFFIFGTAPSIQSIHINCNYTGYDYNSWGKRLTCFGSFENELLEDERFVTSISGEFSNKDCQEDVKGVKIEGQNTKYIPLDLMEHFQNMKELYIFGSKLQHISRYDMKNYKLLTTVSFYNNELSNIPYDTFDDMINLKTLSLSYNNLKEIPNLTKLRILEELYLHHNKIENLKYLDLYQNNNLKILWLYQNSLKKINPNIFDCSIYLENVDLENNICINMKYPQTSKDVIKANIEMKCQ